MTTEAIKDISISSPIELALIQGDLSRLSPNQRAEYYQQTCQSLGLNPLTQPFQYIVLDGKLQLYARKDCTEQLRKIHGVSVYTLTGETLLDAEIYKVTAYVELPGGRKDTATGVVPLKKLHKDTATGVVSLQNLHGEALANAMLKAETKAKRRATLSICGLGMLDESELDSIPPGEIKSYTEAVQVAAEVSTQPNATVPTEGEIAEINQEEEWFLQHVIKSKCKMQGMVLKDVDRTWMFKAIHEHKDKLSKQDFTAITMCLEWHDRIPS